MILSAFPHLLRFTHLSNFPFFINHLASWNSDREMKGIPFSVLKKGQLSGGGRVCLSHGVSTAFPKAIMRDPGRLAEQITSLPWNCLTLLPVSPRTSQ